jgi:hypothetical protein
MNKNRLFWQTVEGIAFGGLLIGYVIGKDWLSAPEAIGVCCLALVVLIVLLPCCNKFTDHFFGGN